MGWADLRTLAARNSGLFTSTHARERGIPGYELARAASRGTIRRVRHGIYALADVDEHPFEEIAAQWLALSPPRTVLLAPNARCDDVNVVVVSHDSAAMMRHLGKATDFGERHFTAGRRMNPKSGAIRTWRRPIQVGDWSVLHGLPVATPARILADLLSSPHDGDEVGSVLDECLNTGLLTHEQAWEIAAPFTARWGYMNGRDLVDGLMWEARPVLVGAHGY